MANPSNLHINSLIIKVIKGYGEKAGEWVTRLETPRSRKMAEQWTSLGSFEDIREMFPPSPWEPVAMTEFQAESGVRHKIAMTPHKITSFIDAGLL
eukprot:g22048.t1